MSYREEKLVFNDEQIPLLPIEVAAETAAVAAQHAAQSDESSTDAPRITDFLMQTGRLPHAGDQIKPWRYRGWLVPYIQKLERAGAIPARYDYALRTIESGKLLDEKIPRVEFLSEFEPSFALGLKMFKKLLDEMFRRTGGRAQIYELCEWLAFALGVTGEPSKMPDDLQLYLYQNFDYRTVLVFAGDYLRHLLSESEYGKRRGFYPTPFDLCELNWWMMSFGASPAKIYN